MSPRAKPVREPDPTPEEVQYAARTIRRVLGWGGPWEAEVVANTLREMAGSPLTQDQHSARWSAVEALEVLAR